VTRAIAILVAAALLTACASQLGTGFHLPPGDPDRGREAFVELRCNSCHELAGIELARIRMEYPVALGGPTTRVQTYGDLVTSIVNPSHRIARGYPPERVSAGGESLLAKVFLNDLMTVQQLVDVVALLLQAYEFVPPPIRPYEYVYPALGADPVAEK
jgi:hypothetical protein